MSLVNYENLILRIDVADRVMAIKRPRSRRTYLMKTVFFYLIMMTFYWTSLGPIYPDDIAM